MEGVEEMTTEPAAHSTEPNAPIPAEGEAFGEAAIAPSIEENEEAGEVEGDETSKEGEGVESATIEPPKKLTYCDHLKSRIITLLVGPAESQTQIPAHLSFLLTSPYFARACASPDITTISLPNDDVPTVGSFLEFLYTGEYAPKLIPDPSGRSNSFILEEPEGGESTVDEDGEQLLKHARIYTLAERLEMPELKQLAHSKIHRINSTARGELRYARYVYEHTEKEDTTIRHPIASFWAHRSHVLRHEAEEDFRRMILEFPQFAYDILQTVLDAKEKGKDKESKREAIVARESFNSSTPAEKVPRSSRKRPRLSAAFSSSGR